jgi:hypothetical protein
MPFKVTYRICSAGKDAPFFTTTDKRLATVEFHEQQRTKGMLSVRMRTDVQPTGRLSKQEEYLWLVYRVRQAIHRYYDRRNKVSKQESSDDLKVSLALESELDKWNARTRFYLQGHPKASHGDEAAFAFFEVVEEWRNCWHKYFAYKRVRDKDLNVEREMKKQCFDYEKAIDEYINKTIGI